MNILHLTTQFNMGGISRYIQTLAQAQIKLGHQVWVAAASGTANELLEDTGIHFIHLPLNSKSDLSPKLLMNYFKLKKLMVANNITVIHAHKRTSQLLGFFLQKNIGCQFITTCHGPYKLRLGRRLLPCWGDHVIAISTCVKNYLEKNYPRWQTKIALILNGIDLHACNSTTPEEQMKLRKQLQLTNKIVIGCVGRLAPEKGQALLIRAFANVVLNYPNTHLLLLGSGNCDAQLEQLIKTHQLEHAVHILPAINNPHPIYSIIDIYVQPSKKEALGLALMEAQAHGLPVIAPAQDGFLDTIIPEQTGLWLSNYTEEAMQTSIETLLKQPEKARQLGLQARQYARAHYTLEAMAIKINALLC